MIGRFGEGNMNDRFKFRAWSKQLERMVCIDEMLLFRLAEIDSDLVFEQCTGLKDKNGRLIYEGDIVKAFVQEDYCLIGYIVWNIDRWQIKDVTGPVFFDLYDAVCDKDTGHDKHTIEVIGNIHENKELLKGEQECN